MIDDFEHVCEGFAADLANGRAIPHYDFGVLDVLLYEAFMGVDGVGDCVLFERSTSLMDSGGRGVLFWLPEMRRAGFLEAGMVHNNVTLVFRMAFMSRRQYNDDSVLENQLFGAWTSVMPHEKVSGIFFHDLHDLGLEGSVRGVAEAFCKGVRRMPMVDFWVVRTW